MTMEYNPQYKVYILDGQEKFVTETKEHTLKKEYQFPDSLIDFLYVHFKPLMGEFEQLGRDIESLYQKKESQYARNVLDFLHRMAGVHPYFEITYHVWEKRFRQAEEQEFKNIIDLLPRKQLTWIPSEAVEIQRQVMDIFENCLDRDLSKGTVNERLTSYFKKYQDDSLKLFRFDKLKIKYEMVEDKAFTDVLYPKSVYDVVDYILRECVKKEQPVRKCKNCHKYFAIRGRTDTEYCSRVIDGMRRTCRDLGASYLWEEKKKSDEIFKVYRREYKKRFAWIKSGKISQEGFYSWSEEARRQKELCDKGIITLDEFKDWLKK